MKKIVLLISLFILVSINGFSQSFALKLSGSGFQTNNSKKVLFRGGDIEILSKINSVFSWGFFGEFQLVDGTISEESKWEWKQELLKIGTSFEVNIPNQKIMYSGLEVYYSKLKYLSETSKRENFNGFGVAPKIGLNINFSNNFSLFIEGKYNFIEFNEHFNSSGPAGMIGMRILFGKIKKNPMQKHFLVKRCFKKEIFKETTHIKIVYKKRQCNKYGLKVLSRDYLEKSTPNKAWFFNPRGNARNLKKLKELFTRLTAKNKWYRLNKAFNNHSYFILTNSLNDYLDKVRIYENDSCAKNTPMSSLVQWRSYHLKLGDPHRKNMQLIGIYNHKDGRQFTVWTDNISYLFWVVENNSLKYLEIDR